MPFASIVKESTTERRVARPPSSAALPTLLLVRSVYAAIHSVHAVPLLLVVLPVLVHGVGCGENALVSTTQEQQRAEREAFQNPLIDRGREVWFNSTFGGEKFFQVLRTGELAGQIVIPPERRIDVAFRQLIETPRSQRFEAWGVINDPDCRADPAGGPDLCDDPAATGVLGIRKSVAMDGTLQYGVTCASCHAGFDPILVPADPSEPTWDNIHPTIGNQYLQAGKLFGANLDPSDPRRILFDSWPRGTVDTTLLFSDNINNPSVFTVIWGLNARARFHVTFEGVDAGKHIRNAQGGEDDLGGQRAALRVYTNLGVCFAECTLLALALGGPIDLDACQTTCPDFPPDSDIDALVEFLETVEAPKFPGKPKFDPLYRSGRKVFDHACASCHDRSGPRRRVLTNDEIELLVNDPEVTNTCRARSTNWDAGQLWAEFSSDQFKARVEDGRRGYRSFPISGAWATPPFLHNQSVGFLAPANAQPHERAIYFFASMFDLLRRDRPPLVERLPVDVGPFPAGTPLAQVFNRDPTTQRVLCDDEVENRGHTFGADLSLIEKTALSYWLLFQ